MNVSAALRLFAVILFVLAAAGVAPFGASPIAVGLACWCGSTLV